ncbi:MAG: potassium transporter Kef [Spirochaetia bacterium]|nr:potassium transporter Kef [Spirochaetia bacterium]
MDYSFLLSLKIPIFLASASGEHNILQDIGVSIVFATILAHIAKLIKQPLILGYILAGVILGKEMGYSLVTDEASIEVISEIGLILLLFIIGLEINLPELTKMGKAVFILGIFQFSLSVVFLYGILSIVPFPIGAELFDKLYLCIALSLSSTLIVIKLLQDKAELSTLSGKLTVGILIFQDIWAILFMGVQPNLNDPQIIKILTSFGSIFVILIMAFIISKYILDRLFRSISTSPELVLLTSMMWCFGLCGMASFIGLSIEMGALIAGLSIAAFPFGGDVISKVIGIRDFFITLFFVTLGLKVPMPTLMVVKVAFLVVVLMLFIRLITIFPLVYSLGRGVRNAFVTTINLAQISEFSLVILALGAGFKHITEELRAIILTATIIASVLSTYLIVFNHSLASQMAKFVEKFGIKEKEDEVVISEEGKTEAVRDILILGYFRIGRTLINLIEHIYPQLAERIIIADYNPSHKEQLNKAGFKWIYADLAHLESLEHVGVHHASYVICTISDAFLKGTTNTRLLSSLKKMAPHSKIILTVDDPQDGVQLVKDGAYKAILPAQITGEYLFDFLSLSIRKI